MAQIHSGSRLAVGTLVMAVAVTMTMAVTSAFTQSKSSDQALKDRIERRLQTDAQLGKYDLKVSVDDGDVKLEGAVANESQKSAAASIARVAGIDDIDNEIDVDRDIDQVLANRASRGLRRNGEAVSDSWITTKINWLMIGEPSLDGSRIEVETDDRVVKLDGKVRTSEAKARAVELANKVDGVVKVIDELDVDRD